MELLKSLPGSPTLIHVKSAVAEDLYPFAEVLDSVSQYLQDRAQCVSVEVTKAPFQMGDLQPCAVHEARYKVKGGCMMAQTEERYIVAVAVCGHPLIHVV